MTISVHAQNPYVGPRPFETGETLYGRAREILDLLDLLIAERIVLLYSPSGAGKTSLIQAGLIPKLEKKNFRILPVMRVGLGPPPDAFAGQAPKFNRYILSLLLSLEEGLEREQQIGVTELAQMTLSDYLEHRETQAESAKRTVVIFDQFEEILTLNPIDQKEKVEFFTQVGIILRQPDCWALFSMREEFPAGLDPYLRLIPTRFKTTFRLELLQEEAARQAIQQPARQTGVLFSDEAAVKLTNDLCRVRVQQLNGSTEECPGLYVEPVQLQVVCYRLWDHLPAGTSEIQETHIQRAGDVNTALAGYYADRVAATVQTTGVRERIIREWFDKQLITEQGLRGQVLHGPKQSQGLSNRAIIPLVDAHLVRAENRRGATWYELAHDRLISPVRNNNADWFQANLSTLQRQAALWDEQNRPVGLLLRGDALKNA